MDIRRWGGSGTQRIVYGRSFSEHRYDRFVTLDTIEIKTTPNKMRRFWRSLRRKLNREKKKVFGCPSTAPAAAQDAYSPHTYSQNFDHGSTWSEPDNLSRSFSARFAAASRVFNSGWTDGREREKGAR
ncbi:hypothetical protein Nepgr_019509 [Nepenthes gracilis]|uniref:Uncharacterized protein n=1 Tax=Nepenthes gracilis TaxID=150966 RepID=A0AAD3XUG2_NEPGR|nr:hypothetical protein Nepgr_019509 [Nepenthes gracilis]